MMITEPLLIILEEEQGVRKGPELERDNNITVFKERTGKSIENADNTSASNLQKKGKHNYDASVFWKLRKNVIRIWMWFRNKSGDN